MTTRDRNIDRGLGISIRSAARLGQEGQLTKGERSEDKADHTLFEKFDRVMRDSPMGMTRSEAVLEGNHLGI